MLKSLYKLREMYVTLKSVDSTFKISTVDGMKKHWKLVKEGTLDIVEVSKSYNNRASKLWWTEIAIEWLNIWLQVFQEHFIFNYQNISIKFLFIILWDINYFHWLLSSNVACGSHFANVVISETSVARLTQKPRVVSTICTYIAVN